MTDTTVVAATVTYGDRAETCLQVARAALDRGAAVCIIVDNGSSNDSRDLLVSAARSDDRLRLVRLATNGGSAVGFSTAISHALDAAGSGWVWLLDDDNLPRPGALRQALDTAAQHGPGVAVACLRSSDPMQLAVVAGAPVERTLAFRGSFLGFDLMTRLRRRPTLPPRPRGAIEIPWAPYGGLLVGADDARRVDPPYASFVLYGDDRDWCARLRAVGTRILLDPDAVVDDLVDRWTTEESPQPGGVLQRMIMSGDRRRAYFLVRNTAFQDRQAIRTPSQAIRFATNVAIYGATVVRTALHVGRPMYIRLFARALVSGLAGRWYGPRRA